MAVEDRPSCRGASWPMKPAWQAKRRKPGDGVAGGSTARLARRAHMHRRGARLDLRRSAASQPLCMPCAARKSSVGVGDDVDDGIADGEHVEAAVGHSGLRRMRESARLASVFSGRQPCLGDCWRPSSDHAPLNPRLRLAPFRLRHPAAADRDVCRPRPITVPASAATARPDRA